MEANKTILQMKYARIVKLFSEQSGLSLEKTHWSSSTTRMSTKWLAKGLPTCTVAVMVT